MLALMQSKVAVTCRPTAAVCALSAFTCVRMYLLMAICMCVSFSQLLTIQYVYDYAEILKITNCARIVAGVGLVDFRYG